MNPLAPFEARPRLSAIVGALAIAFSGIFYRLSAVSPSTAVFFRALYGLPLLLVVARSENRRLGPMTRRAVGLSGVAGVFFAVDRVVEGHEVDREEQAGDRRQRDGAAGHPPEAAVLGARDNQQERQAVQGPEEHGRRRRDRRQPVEEA